MWHVTQEVSGQYVVNINLFNSLLKSSSPSVYKNVLRSLQKFVFTLDFCVETKKFDVEFEGAQEDFSQDRFYFRRSQRDLLYRLTNLVFLNIFDFFS